MLRVFGSPGYIDVDPKYGRGGSENVKRGREAIHCALFPCARPLVFASFPGKKLNITRFCSVLLDSARFVSFLFAGWARKNPQPAEKNSMALDFARFRSISLDSARSACFRDSLKKSGCSVARFVLPRPALALLGFLVMPSCFGSLGGGGSLC